MSTPLHVVAPNAKPVVLVQAKQVYGQWKFYPSNEAAGTFAQLTRTATLSPEQLKQIEALGFHVEVLQQKVSFK
jgi:hypothetical protein